MPLHFLLRLSIKAHLNETTQTIVGAHKHLYLIHTLTAEHLLRKPPLTINKAVSLTGYCHLYFEVPLS